MIAAIGAAAAKAHLVRIAAIQAFPLITVQTLKRWAKPQTKTATQTKGWGSMKTDFKNRGYWCYCCRYLDGCL
jgi:hypothetical protein